MMVNWIMIGYLSQAIICAIINIVITTRIPISFWDFIKLTFLPYLLLHLKEVRYDE